MNIEDLLNKYFEGETTCEEERELRHFFTDGLVPEHLKIYRPMFAFFDEESKQEQTKQKRLSPTLIRHRILYIFSGIAAGVIILLGIAGIRKHMDATPKNYVIIDGKCYTDENLVREEAMAAFQNVSFTEDELLNNLLNE